MGIKQLNNDNLRKLPNEYGDVSVMSMHENWPSKRMRRLIVSLNGLKRSCSWSSWPTKAQIDILFSY